MAQKKDISPNKNKEIVQKKNWPKEKHILTHKKH